MDARAYADNIAKLPEHCYALNIATDEIIILTRGQTGYTPTKYGVGTEETINTLNERMEVTKAQYRAMLLGSFAGFHAPGANPDIYDEEGRPKSEMQRAAEQLSQAS